MAQIPFTIRRDDDNQIMGTGNFDDTLLGGATIPVELIRTDNADNVTGEFFIDPAKVYPVQTASKVLYLQRVNNEYVQFTEVFYAGEFDIECTVQDGIQEGSWCPLFGGASVTNRVLISGISNEIALNIGSSTLVKKPVDIDMTALNTIRLFRDTENDIWVQINGNAPQFLYNLTSTFGVKWFGKTNTFEWTGYLHAFRIGANIFNLSEQTGDVLTSTNSLMTATVKSDIAQPHINNNVWAFAPPTTFQIEVINMGISGSNSGNMLSAIANVINQSPDLVYVMTGTNSALNVPSKYEAPFTTFYNNLTSYVTQLLAANISVILMPPIPCVNSIVKPTHDYTGYYTEPFDLNVDVLPLYRQVVQQVSTELNVGYIDVVTDFDPGVHLGVDGVHLSDAGKNFIAQKASTGWIDEQKICCAGDSNTVIGYPLLLSQILNS